MVSLFHSRKHFWSSIFRKLLKVTTLGCYQNDQLVGDNSVVSQARDTKCWVCDYDVRVARYLEISDAGASICQISAHCTTPARLTAASVQRFKSPGLSKNEIFSLLLLLLLLDLISDLSRWSPMLPLSSPNTSTSSLITSLHPALSISASRLNLCF